jgi:glycosyltransferase involved in cell wall biosynthesis
VVVMDDGSTDSTAAIVQGFAGRDARVRLVQAPALPPGWTGKVHACARLAEAARGSHLLFIDADVRLAPHAAAAMAAHSIGKKSARRGAAHSNGRRAAPGDRLAGRGADGALRQLPPPQLPARRRRRLTRQSSLAAACGQLVLVERAAYEAIGGPRRHPRHPA